MNPPLFQSAALRAGRGCTCTTPAKSPWTKFCCQYHATTAEAQDVAALGKGLIVFLALLLVLFAVLSAVLAVRMKSGGNATRVCSIIYGSFVVLSGLISLPGGIVTLVFGILIIVFAAKADSAAWFQRPRH
ncbi:hypothetical protein [Streptomyces sp. NPDC088554]